MCANKKHYRKCSIIGKPALAISIPPFWLFSLYPIHFQRQHINLPHRPWNIKWGKKKSIIAKDKHVYEQSISNISLLQKARCKLVPSLSANSPESKPEVYYSLAMRWNINLLTSGPLLSYSVKMCIHFLPSALPHKVIVRLEREKINLQCS